MKRLLALIGTFVTLSLAGPAAPASAAPTVVDVAFDRATVSASIGDRFSLRSGFANGGPTSSGGYIAHLNIASLTNDVYVDPEDWCSDRSQDVRSMSARSQTSLTWDLQAVNAGRFDVYLVLLPVDAAPADAGPLLVSPPVRLTVAPRNTITAGGVLPVAVAMPVLLGLIVLAPRLRRRISG